MNQLIRGRQNRPENETDQGKQTRGRFSDESPGQVLK